VFPDSGGKYGCRRFDKNMTRFVMR